MLCMMFERGDVCAFADELEYVSLAFFSRRCSLARCLLQEIDTF